MLSEGVARDSNRAAAFLTAGASTVGMQADEERIRPVSSVGRPSA